MTVSGIHSGKVTLERWRGVELRREGEMGVVQGELNGNDLG